MEVILDGYWQTRPPADVKAGILADWCDALEDWTQEQVLYALRWWRNENPSRKPNPGHILSKLKDMRGRAELKRNPPKPVLPPYSSPLPRGPEEKAQVAEMVSEVGSSLRQANSGGAA